jgi:hypothetical protein
MSDDIVTRLRRCPEQFPPYSVRTDAAAEIERLRAVERRSHDLWWLAYHHGPVTLTVRGSHEMYRTVTVDGISYNVDDPADVALLEARRER